MTNVNNDDPDILAVKRRRYLKTVGAASTGLVAGCTGQNGSQDENTTGGNSSNVKTFKNEAGIKVGSTFEGVKELAKEEEEATIYAAIDTDPMQNVIDAFNEKYPNISVNHITGGSEDLASRWDSEYKSDNTTADLINSSKVSRVLDQNQAMALSADYVPTFGEIGKNFKDEDGFWIGLWLTPGALFYNTDMASEDDVSDWMDLVTTEKWSNQKIGWDPTPNMFLMTWLLETQGREFFKNLREQRPRFVDSHSDLARFTGAGEFPFSFTYTHKMADYGDQLPVDYFKWDPMPAFLSPLLLNNKAPNPNSGLVFLNWFTSKEGQQILGQNSYVPYHPEAEFASYPGIYPSDKYDIATVNVEANIEQTAEVWKELMGDLL